MKRLILSIALIVFASAATIHGQGQGVQNAADQKSTQLGQNDPVITKEQAAKIIQELQLIRMLLQEQAATNAGARGTASVQASTAIEHTETVLNLDDLGDRLAGAEHAPITLVEFVDLQCPYCMEFHKLVLPQLREKYIRTGKLRFAVYNFPLDSHAYAVQAAALATCAGQQGMYWNAYDKLLDEPKVATEAVLSGLSASLGLDQSKVDGCLHDPQTITTIQQQIALGRKLGVIGTPTFVLGKSQRSGVTGALIEGFLSFDTWEKRIEALLEASKEASHVR